MFCLVGGHLMAMDLGGNATVQSLQIFSQILHWKAWFGLGCITLKN